mgnify:FL=1
MDANRYEIADDPARVDRDAVHRWLAASYWAGGIPREVCDRAIDGSMPFGVYARSSGAQVAFCRLVTADATFAGLADVVVDDAHRGSGIGTR